MASVQDTNAKQSIYDFTEARINGTEESLDKYKGKVLLIVNTASKCGFTPQFAGLEQLYKDYQDKDFEILGFPSNQFLHQDPGSNAEINEFCQMNYGVSFPMFAKIKVRGKEKNPLYDYLIENSNGKAIKWNFTKFLIGRDGEIIERFEPKDKPEDIAPKLAEILD
ncbi:glutathione peroxidase [Agrilactobacillus composti DSM 18527 = JCM 14202]|uniref:Glutathione peroxidase n=1 Tax=Agrilactobacillus composti DSM 18527 = JCM 14202 TaxID=1423734 RepID=X0PML6_9LACO|nr:glutathione peroxidase [Agrilactobacillus composti]KRM34880.1 glutathione peroxidase [Agrilactobacillus composti DSM 18527 = JCM 14202]GAF38752.1 glutathione peroxidase family protein [Agrilactobacillus composti DSM 18527 = JCM 14202]